MSTKTTQTNTAGPADRPTEKKAPAKTNPGPEDRFHQIQICAYSLWEKAGKPSDDKSRERFWYEAEKAMTAS